MAVIIVELAVTTGGVPWNERHCHGGGSVQQQPLEIQPTQKPLPTFTPKPTSTPKPTLTPKPTIIPSPNPTPTIEITSSPTLEPTPKENYQIMGEKMEIRLSFWQKILRLFGLIK